MTRTRKRDVHERRVVREPQSPCGVEMTPVESEFYAQVTAAVRKYCRDFDMAEGFLLTVPQRQMCSSMAAACRSWSRRSHDLKTRSTRSSGMRSEMIRPSMAESGSARMPTA